MIAYKHDKQNLPWVTNKLRKLINNKNMAYSRKKENQEKFKQQGRSGYCTVSYIISHWYK